MGTLTEVIFSHKLGRAVAQGETVVVDVDRVMSHDTTTPLAIQAFRKLTNGGRVFDSQRSHIVFDHIVPAATIAAATLHRDVRAFAQEQDIGILQEGAVMLVQVISSLELIATPAPMGRLEPLPRAWALPTSGLPMQPDEPGFLSRQQSIST